MMRRKKTVLTIGILGVTACAVALAAFSVWSCTSVLQIRERAGLAQGFSVAMSPMGEVRFRHVPQRAVTLDANYNDMLVALSEGRKLAATGYRGNEFDGFYKDLGVSEGYDAQRLTYLSGGAGAGFDKELLYSLRAEVHHIDPVQLAAMKGWSRADVDEIARNVGPFFANRYSRDNNYQGKEPYEYYSLFELSARIGSVYRKAGRMARLKSVCEEMVKRIQNRLPPPEQRPRIGLVFYGNGRFTPYSVEHGGFGQAQYRDVGARDAFSSIQTFTYGAAGGRGAMLDKEGLLALDPDVLIVPFAIYPATQPGTSRVAFELLLKQRDDPIIGRLKAFRSGHVYPGGTPLQGPVFYLFQIEMAAKQIYPEIFGPYREDRNYPANEQLFDRRRVAAILTDHGD